MDASRRSRFRLTLQRVVAHAALPFVLPPIIFFLAVVRGCSLRGAEETRREYRRIRRETPGPLLVCANHLTLVDSFMVSGALAPLRWFLLHPWQVPWNTPEATYFATTRLRRIVLYLLKCLPIRRRSGGGEVARVLEDFSWVVSRGDVGLIFPEGGRSATGRVELDAAAYGVGRVVAALPGCRVVCVYMRGDGQERASILPRKGEKLSVRLTCIEPKSDQRGLRRSLDVSRQIVEQLRAMEQEYFDDRQ